MNCPDAEHCAHCLRDAFCNALPDPSSSGIAELPGQNFVVGFGSYIDQGVPLPLSIEAAIFMHELGHNLGLLHGGTDACVNWKPNYVSVMNFAYLFNGILFADTPGSNTYQLCSSDSDCGRGAACEPRSDIHYCFKVDFSNQELPSLNEFSPSVGIGGLAESVGVSGRADDTNIVTYFATGPTQLFGSSFGPIDWNNDSDWADGHVQADINNDGLLRS